MPGQDQLLTAKQVAERLQITEAWVHEAARNGDLPYIEIGRYRRFEQADIDEWIASKRKRRTP